MDDFFPASLDFLNFATFLHRGRQRVNKRQNMDTELTGDCYGEASSRQPIFRQREQIQPGPTVPHACATRPQTLPWEWHTHLGVLDPDRAGRQRLCHYLALRGDNCDRLIHCATSRRKKLKYSLSLNDLKPYSQYTRYMYERNKIFSLMWFLNCFK